MEGYEVMEKLKTKSLIPILIALPSFGLGLTWNMKSTILPLLVKTVTTSNFKLGLLAAAGPVAGIIFPYLSGVISDRTNLKMGKRKPWMLLGGILGSIFLIILGLSKEYIIMFISAFGVYASFNFFQGSYYAWIPEAVEENQIGKVNGLGKLFYSLGGMLFFLLGVSLFHKNREFPFILILLAVLIPITISTTLVKEDDSNFRKPSKLSFDFLKNSSAMRVFLGAFFFYIAYGLITPFWIPYYEKALKFTSNEISLALIGFTFTGLILSIVVGFWCDKWNKQYIFLIATLIYIIAFIIGWDVKGLVMLWIFALLSGVAFVIFQVVFYSLIPVVAPKEKLGEYMGINNIFLCIPQIISSLLGGYLLTINKGIFIFPISIISLIIGAIIIGYKRLKTN